jgi:tartrate-resistant acid phosphatase type 5
MILALSLLVSLALASPDDELGFVFFGDSGTGGPAQLRVAEQVQAFCATERCDLALLLGDNVMPDGVSGVDDPQWESKVETPYAGLGLGLWAVLGNHDHRGDVQAQVDYSERSELWHMPARYYAFERGPVAFFALDTQAMDRAQRRWLRRGLRQSQAPWTVVYGHHPLRSHGEHGPAKRPLSRIRCAVERHADLYLSGHDHGQEVLAGRATYVVMGSGGSPPRAIEPGDDSLYAASRRGFGHLLADEQGALLRVIEANGELRFELELRQETQP